MEERTQAATTIKDVADRVRENIGKVIVGSNEVIELTLVALLADGHILIEDVPGIGKTMPAGLSSRAGPAGTRSVSG